MQGYSIPETTAAYGATLLNAAGDEFTDPLGPARCRLAGDLRRGRGRPGRRDARTAARPVLLDTTRIPEQDAEIPCRTCSVATVPRRSTLCASRS
jgi:hypothetical protein